MKIFLEGANQENVNMNNISMQSEEESVLTTDLTENDLSALAWPK